MGDDQIGHVVVDRLPQENDVLLEQPRVDIGGALAPRGLLDDHRLLNPRWRNLVGEMHGPYERKQVAAVKWISQYGDYIHDLEGYVSGVMLRPDLFNGLPFNGQLRELSADECIRRLSLQEAALKRIQGSEIQGPRPSTITASHALSDELQAVVKRKGTKHVGSEAGLNRDTVGDVAGRRVVPQRATVNKLKKYLDSEKGRA